MKIKIALAGNPNCGKTTMFNELTGSNQYVGNWPGVTVEKKEGKLRENADVILQDLPGIYSLSVYTPEEVVARDYLIEEHPNAILNIVDGTNLERNLYLSTQLLELGIPLVIAVNMMDLVTKRGDRIDLRRLGETLGCEMVETSALRGSGLQEAAARAVSLAHGGREMPIPHIFSPCVEHALSEIQHFLPALTCPGLLRWYAIKLFERDKTVIERLRLEETFHSQLEPYILQCEQELQDDSESLIISQRYDFIGKLSASCLQKNQKISSTATDRIDRIVTNRFLALPIFAFVMLLVYGISITTVGSLLTDWTNDVLFGSWILPAASGLLAGAGVAPWLSGLVTDGIIGGVGAVLGFVPQMLILFLMLSVLEECGYMARVAFIMDRIFRRFGLSGKSFIPMLIGSGCSVPGIMAARTIEQERDRRLTVMTTSFIPCGAKMPIIALIAGALFGGAWWVAPCAYFIGVASVIVSGIILKKTNLFTGKPSPFVLELPAYHMPMASNILRSTWERGWSFIRRAGTVILLSSVVLWFLQAFGWADGMLRMVDDNQYSLLADAGRLFAPVFAPLGFGSWQAAVGTFTGLIAKENVVGTLGVLYGFSEVAENGMDYWTLFAKDFTMLSAFSFLIFNLLCAPCFAAIGAIRREMNSARWTWFAIGYLCLFAYSASFLVYQFGLLLTGGGITLLTVLSFLLTGIALYLIFRPECDSHAAKQQRFMME